MILLPLLTWAIIELFAPNIPNAMKIGIMILMICPGGSTSNFITYFTKGDTPLSTSLTITNTILGIASIPLLASFFIFYYSANSTQINLPLGQTILTLLIAIALPLFIGTSINHKNSPLAKKLEKFLLFL
jgi:BASS family bile acid:Na+ symporter